MFDAKLVMQVVTDPRQKIRLRNPRQHHQMHRQRGFRRTHRPHMAIMDRANAREFDQIILNRRKVDMTRHPVEGQVEGGLEELGRADQNDDRDNPRSQRIDPLPPRQRNHHTTHHHAHRHQHIRQHMEERALTIYIMIVMSPMEQLRRQAIDQHPHQRDNNHRLPRHWLRMQGPLNRFESEECRHAEQQTGIQQRGKDRGFAESIGVADAGTTTGQPDCAPGDQEAQDIAEIVARIGEEGEGIAQDAEGRLGDDEGEVEDETDFEGAIGRWGVVGMGVIMHLGNGLLYINPSLVFRQLREF